MFHRLGSGFEVAPASTPTAMADEIRRREGRYCKHGFRNIALPQRQRLGFGLSLGETAYFRAGKIRRQLLPNISLRMKRGAHDYCSMVSLDPGHRADQAVAPNLLF